MIIEGCTILNNPLQYLAHADGVNVMSRYGHKLKAKIMQL